MLLENIRVLLESAGDDYWEAVASRGLLRRAQKDLENNVQVVLEGEQAGFLALTVAGFNIRIPPQGPARATCTCPAPGVCQHIIVACLFLKGAGGSQPAAPGRAREEMLAISVDELKRWAGAPIFRAAVRLLLAQPDVVVEERNAITVRFTRLAAYCIYSPGAGLNGIVVTAPASRARRLAVAAVLAFQRHCGLQLPDIQKLAEPGIPPRTRDQVLDGSIALFQEMVTVGLSHVTESTGERLSTLSLSALAVNLPRLSLALRDAVDNVKMLGERHAQADEARLLALLSRTFALAEAIRDSQSQPRPNLISQRRTEYYDVHRLDLSGVAAYPWRTGSGYQGLTVLFWQNSDRRWFSWSDARPEGNLRAFDPLSRYDSEGPWVGVHSPRQASRSDLAITRARVNGLGRLSSTTACRAGVLGPAPVADLDFGERLFTRTADLLQYAASCRGIGLLDPNPLDALVVFQPAVWGPRAFDEINQRFIWLVADESGHSIPLDVAYDPLHSAAIRWMESASSLSGCKVIARIAGHGTSISLYPISVIGSDYGENNIFHLALDAAREQDAAKSVPRPAGQPQPGGCAQSGAASNPPDRQHRNTDSPNQPEKDALPDDDLPGPEGAEADYEAESDESMGGGFAYADPSLTRLEEALEALAESGAGSLNIPCRDRLRGLSEELAGRGLILLARHASRLAAGDGGFAHDLLRCCYICDLHRQALRSGL